MAALRQAANTVGGGGGAEEGKRRRSRGRRGSGGKWGQRTLPSGRTWLMSETHFLPRILLFPISMCISLSQASLFFVRCFLCYRTATIPHQKSRTLSKTAPPSFSWKLVFLVLCLGHHIPKCLTFEILVIQVKGTLNWWQTMCGMEDSGTLQQGKHSSRKPPKLIILQMCNKINVTVPSRSEYLP